MVRFQPDGWLEVLLRPLILADPQAGVYFEDMAPDGRFAVLALLVAVVAFHRKRWATFTPPQRQLAWAFLAVFCVWTLVIGNGRYFITGLMVAGPLLVAVWSLLPGTLVFRWSLLAVICVLQVVLVTSTYVPNHWGLVRWESGDGIPIEPTPLREKPAIFISSTGISFSMLIPRFHPQSRWANVSGQHDITPEMGAWKRLHAMLGTDLPKYALVPIPPSLMTPEGQPVDLLMDVYAGLLKPQGLQFNGDPCQIVRSHLAPGPRDAELPPGTTRGFWFCPLSYTPPPAQKPESAAPIPARFRLAFDAIERHCPRFFPPGRGIDRTPDDIYMRAYDSDTRLLATQSGRVYLKYFRALNPTFIGTVDDIQQGRFDMPCDKLPGRYRPLWADGN